MSEQKIRTGVVGVGHLGKWHAEQLKLIKTADLIGIFDADFNRAAEIAANLKTSSFKTFDELLKECEALSIVTPTSTHFSYASAAIKAGKHVFIEKPITETVKQGERLLELVKGSGLKLQVGHIERFNPAIIALEGVIKNPLFIESHRLSTFNPRGTDVAVVLDLMIHDIDLILSFIQSPVKTIHASGVQIISQKEDIANCRLEFENGAVANVTASRISTRKMRKMRFFQPNAYISVDFSDGKSEVYQIKEASADGKKSSSFFSLGIFGDDQNKKEIRFKKFTKKNINPLNYELTLFLNSILNNDEVAVSGQDGVRALRVAQEILDKISAHSEILNKNLVD